MAVESSASDPHEFSLILGGPLYQVCRRAHLCGTAAELLLRRLLTLCAVAWVPLFAFSALAGTAWGDAVRLTFLRDVDVQARLLVALPLLIIAELVVHQRMRFVVGQFDDRNLVPESSRRGFDAAIESAMRLRNSIVAEIIMLGLVFGVGVLVIYPKRAILGIDSWSGLVGNSGPRPSLAGWWFRCVSLPLFQFILLRWYFRLFIWARFLWRVSKLELNLVAVHPDRSAGLGFLSHISFALTPLLLAQGALVAGVIGDQILFGGAKLPQFKADIAGLLILALMIVVGPLLVFAPRLTEFRRKALAEYGALAQRCVESFEQKWLQHEANGARLLETTDLRTLGSLEKSFEVIKQIRGVPFNFQTLLRLILVTLVPLAPLLLTMISAEELFKRLVRVVF